METKQLSPEATLMWGNDPEAALKQLKDMKEILENALEEH